MNYPDYFQITEIAKLTVTMKRELEFDFDIRKKLTEDCKKNDRMLQSIFEPQKHTILIDVITLTANGNMEKAEKFLGLSLKFLDLCNENASACFICSIRSHSHDLLYELWKYAYVEAQWQPSNEEPRTQDHLENIYIVISTFFYDEELRERTCAFMRELIKLYRKESQTLNGLVHGVIQEYVEQEQDHDPIYHEGGDN